MSGTVVLRAVSSVFLSGELQVCDDFRKNKIQHDGVSGPKSMCACQEPKGPRGRPGPKLIRDSRKSNKYHNKILSIQFMKNIRKLGSRKKIGGGGGWVWVVCGGGGLKYSFSRGFECYRKFSLRTFVINTVKIE
jgi:hypothetical protein